MKECSVFGKLARLRAEKRPLRETATLEKMNTEERKKYQLGEARRDDMAEQEFSVTSEE